MEQDKENYVINEAPKYKVSCNLSPEYKEAVQMLTRHLKKIASETD